MQKKRPKNLNLISIRLPLPALVSILHRVSGVILFLIIPALLIVLQTSLRSPEGFKSVAAVMAHPFVKLLLLGFCWAFLHHMFAGVRHLMSDMSLGLELHQARFINKLVLWGAITFSLAVGMILWLA